MWYCWGVSIWWHVFEGMSSLSVGVSLEGVCLRACIHWVWYCWGVFIWWRVFEGMHSLGVVLGGCFYMRVCSEGMLGARARAMCSLCDIQVLI